MTDFSNKKILIGITGSIAVYKTCELIRLFKKAGCEVKLAATEAALKFVGEKTFETLTGYPVYVDTFQKFNETKHISLADWADVFIIAPVSANTISKIANGIADNLLTSIFCAYFGKNKQAFIAPAMNEGMWKNIFVQKNIQTLKIAGVNVINPIEGKLACGYEGVGKMEEPLAIFNFVKDVLNKEKINIPRGPENCNLYKCDFNSGKRKKVIVTSGGTKEYIDPVRFITNASSGKMGNSIADSAHNMGHEVVLITTTDVEKPYKTINATTAEDMKKAIEAEFLNADYLIMAAAVSDFKIKNFKNHKIRKNEINNDTYTIELGLNLDILKYIADKKQENQKVIGFSLSTENVIEIAKEKLQTKNCDFIVANEAKTALNSDTSEVWIVDKKSNVQKIGPKPKTEIAQAILEIVL